MKTTPRPGPVSPPPPGPPFSSELDALVVRFEERSVKVGELLEATRTRGLHSLLLLVALPFVGPVPLPGFSIPFGLAVTMIGVALFLGEKPWLPQSLLRRELSSQTLARLLRGTARLMVRFEAHLRPRLRFVEGHAVFGRISGLLITISGLFMMLPFPLPFSNSLPAWTVIFLSLGAIGRDGLFFILGVGSFVLSVAFFTFVAVGGWVAIERLTTIGFGK